jgi:type II secretory pathway component GspD/PulD (secretin)
LMDQVSWVPPPTTGTTTQPTLNGGVTQQGISTQPQYIPVGSSLYVTPTITKDKKHVLLNITTNQTDLLRFKDHIVQGPIGTTTTTSGVTTAGAEVVTYPVRVPETETASLSTRVSVPDRGTLLLGGHKIMAQFDKEAGVPVLSKIPVLGRLFSNRSSVRDQKVLLILVKPTIILQEETDQEAVASLEEQNRIVNGF